MGEGPVPGRPQRVLLGYNYQPFDPIQVLDFSECSLKQPKKSFNPQCYLSGATINRWHKGTHTSEQMGSRSSLVSNNQIMSPGVGFICQEKRGYFSFQSFLLHTQPYTLRASSAQRRCFFIVHSKLPYRLAEAQVIKNQKPQLLNSTHIENIINFKHFLAFYVVFYNAYYGNQITKSQTK